MPVCGGAAKPRPGDADKRAFAKKGRENWVADGDAPACSLCETAFTMLNRRHHCRACGGVFCGACAGEKAVFVPKSRQSEGGYKPKEKRLCKTCLAEVRAQSTR